MGVITPAQQEVLNKLSEEWASAYLLHASLSTLDALVRKGLAERRNTGALGAAYSPRTVIEYRKKGQV